MNIQFWYGIFNYRDHSCLKFSFNLIRAEGLFAAAKTQELSNIFQNKIEGRNQQEGDAGGKENSKAEAYSHGDQELCLHAGFQDHRRQAKKSCERCEQDRSETTLAGAKKCLMQSCSSLACAIDLVYQQ